MLIIGMLDDIKMIDYRLKLISQTLAALIIVLSSTRFHFFSHEVLNILLSVFWIVGLTNSLNLLDNMNGLACGLTIIILGFFSVLAYFTDHAPLALFLAIPIGSLLGFFPYNFPKAKIFLGDGGSLFLGFSLAASSIWLFEHLIQHEVHILTALSCLLLLASIPILDTLTVVIIRIKNRQPIYVGDTNHLSHQLVRAGLSATAAVMILYACTFITGAISLIHILNY
jgi:UDP-GlcNAc:undecaprenyl-phosphate GlcNAc-1-phosphate transferase